VIADPPDIVVATTGIGFAAGSRPPTAGGWPTTSSRSWPAPGCWRGVPRPRAIRAAGCTNSGRRPGVLLGTDQRTARRGCGRSAGGRSDARRHH
jgi:hypothetical protein